MNKEILYQVLGPKSWHHMTSYELGEALKITDIVYVPTGAIEQHAYGLPLMTDTYAAEEMARRAVLELDKMGRKAIIGPSIPFGPVANLKFPGSIHVQSTTVILLVKDVCKSLIQYGVKKIILIVGHDLSLGPLMTAARELLDEVKEEHKIIVANFLPNLRNRKLELVKGLIPPGKDDGHGGAGETARILWLYPNLVVKEFLQDYEKDLVETKIPYGEPITLGGSIDIPSMMSEQDPDYHGIIGFPSVATRDMGDTLYTDAGIWLAKIAIEHCF